MVRRAPSGRASEAAAVAIRDLDMRSDGSGSVRLVGKGGKTRHCPLWPTTMTSLRASSGRSPESPCSATGGERPSRGLSSTRPSHWYVADATVACPSLAKKAISPHVIRHTTATHLLRAGVDINSIRGSLMQFLRSL